MDVDGEWTRDDVATRAADLVPRIREAAGASRRVVGMDCSRGARSVIAFAAIRQAGHVPLLGDRAEPTERRRRLREAAGAAVVLSDAADGGYSAVATPATARDADPCAAYCAATSGTTGEPRIVTISRATLDAYTDDVLAAYGLGAADRVLQFAPPGFDVFVEEVAPTLVAGATLVVPTWSHAPAAATFLDHLEEHRVTVVNLPSSYWMAVADHLRETGRPAPEHLRLAVIGSEPVARGLVEWFRERLPGVRLVNAYGTSEVAPTCFLFDTAALPEATSERARVPIGRPLPFATYRIERGTLRLGVAAAGTDLSDTGDLASLGDDGFVYLHGRSDLTRIKRGGVTVNAESLASAARECPGVLDAAVHVDRGTGALVLTVQSGHDAQCVRDAVEGHLDAVLPPAWRPDRLTVLPGVGQVAGAKLSLVGPDRDAAVRDVWARMLGPVALDDDTDFFHAGGDSAGAVRASTLLSDALSTRVPVQLIFANPLFGDFLRAVAALR